ncbi:MAG: DedA family protein [Deltaproteobacteria bacterium]|nr:DedA family protein [Deltaproteobacteria bacterium]
MPELEQLVREYGYLAVLVGTFSEGETILILGGISARLGYLKLSLVIVAAFMGGYLGDLVFFFLGRRQGPAILQKFPRLQTRVGKFQQLLERYHYFLILGFRFLYGLRTVAPLAVGLSRVPVSRYLILDAISALAWAAVVGTAGYFFGSALEIFLGDLKKYELIIFGVIFLLGAVVWLLLHWRRRRTAANRY